MSTGFDYPSMYCVTPNSGFRPSTLCESSNLLRFGVASFAHFWSWCRNPQTLLRIHHICDQRCNSWSLSSVLQSHNSLMHFQQWCWLHTSWCFHRGVQHRTSKCWARDWHLDSQWLVLGEQLAHLQAKYILYLPKLLAAREIHGKTTETQFSATFGNIFLNELTTLRY